MLYVFVYHVRININKFQVILNINSLLYEYMMWTHENYAGLIFYSSTHIHIEINKFLKHILNKELFSLNDFNHIATVLRTYDELTDTQKIPNVNGFGVNSKTGIFVLITYRFDFIISYTSRIRYRQNIRHVNRYVVETYSTC